MSIIMRYQVKNLVTLELTDGLEIKGFEPACKLNENWFWIIEELWLIDWRKSYDQKKEKKKVFFGCFFFFRMIEVVRHVLNILMF